MFFSIPVAHAVGGKLGGGKDNMAIRSRNMDPEAGRWTEPVKLASSTTASFAFLNPTSNSILIEKVVVNVTTAAASKLLYVGKDADGVADNNANEVINAADLVSGQVITSSEETVLTSGQYLVGTLSATDSTLDAYVYIKYKELTK